MYYVIRDIDSYNCSVIKFETLKEAIEWTEKFDDNKSIITKEISAAEKFMTLQYGNLKDK